MAQLLNFVGTGGIIEGNLNDLPVNVNLDASVRLSTGNTSGEGNYIGIPTNADIEALETGGTISAWAKFNSAGSSANYPNVIGLGTGGASGLNVGIFRHSTNDSVFYNVKFADGTSTYLGSSAITHGTWNHFAISFDSGAYNSYFNGVLVNNNTTAQDLFTLGTVTRNGDVLCGAIGTNLNNVETQTNDMEVADARVYSSALGIDDIKILASRINGDPSLISASSNLLLRYKLDGNDISSSTVDNAEGTSARDGIIKQGDGTASTHTLLTDAYSVDVYDNSTTTDGTFTVTQGKVEGLALSSVELNGSDDFININNDLESWVESPQKTFAGWVYSDGNSNEARVFNIAFSDPNSTGFALGFSRNSVNQPFYFLIDTGGSSLIADFGDVHQNNTWMHYAIVTDGANDKAFLYQNGVLQATVSNVGEISQASDVSAKIGKHWASGQSQYFNGKVRDFRLYDYDLSDEQVASLYSNTYPQTPLNHWKLDEGYTSGTTANTAGAFEDSGTGTDLDAQGSGLVNASCVNGTLDLDGNLTIAANGTLSAPRGNLDLSDDLSVTGTFTHNNGKVRAMDTQTIQIQAGNATPLTFYNLEANTGWNSLRGTGGITVLNLLSATTRYNLIRPLDGNVSLTLGTDSDAGGLTGNAIQFTSNGTNYAEIKAASSLKPWTAETAPDFDSGGSGSKVRIADCNMDPNITTGGGGVTLTLSGDCEFDAVTVSSGDEFDLNGQRAEFGGDVTYSGTWDADGLAVFHGGFTKYGTLNNAASGDIMTMHPTGYPTFSYITGYRTFFVNGGVQLGTGGFTNVPTAIMASGILKTGTRDPTATNFTIATGAEFQAEDNTLTISGDFTTSGGLIGTSALNTQYAATRADAVDALRISGDRTIEFWLKYPSSNRPSSGNFKLLVSKDNYGYFVKLDENGKVKAGITSGASSSVTSATAVDDDKWHHIAWVFTTSTADTGNRVYIDGKLDAQASSNGGNTGEAVTFTVGSGVSGSCMDEIRLWNDARTEAEIRANMFSEITSSGNDIIAVYNANEGSGTTAADAIGSLDLTTNSSGWVGAGTFTKGTSTLNMTGASGELYVGSLGKDFYNLQVAPSGGSTALQKVSHTQITVSNLLTHNGGTFSSPDNMSIQISSNGTISSGASIPYICYWASTATVPTATFRFFIANIGTVTFAGDCSCTGYLRTGAQTIVTGAFSHSVRKIVIDSGGTMDLRNSTLTFTGTTSSTEFDESSFNSTILSGNTNLIGHISGSNKTNWKSVAGLNHEIVGNVSNLDFQAGNDFTIVGSVTNCTGEGFRQWHHTLDTQQLLDADEAGDDDLRLTKPALDNALELMTK